MEFLLNTCATVPKRGIWVFIIVPSSTQLYYSFVSCYLYLYLFVLVTMQLLSHVKHTHTHVLYLVKLILESLFICISYYATFNVMLNTHTHYIIWLN